MSFVLMPLRGGKVCSTCERLLALAHLFICLGDKKWLETHLWHAKRMHMENMWGYRLVSITVESASVNSSI